MFDARNKLRSSIIISGIRCIFTYLVVPIAVPLLGFAGALAAPLSIALSVLAIVLGYQSLRRFWLADHRLRWHYTVVHRRRLGACSWLASGSTWRRLAG